MGVGGEGVGVEGWSRVVGWEALEAGWGRGVGLHEGVVGASYSGCG